MKPAKAVACPNCGALNRPTWEYCARCNESLDSVAPTLVEGPAGGGEAVAEYEGDVSAAPANTIALAGLLALAILGALAYRTLSRAPASEPEPSFFTMGTQPPGLPAAQSTQASGGPDYDAGRRALSSGNLPEAIARLQAAANADPTNAEYRKAYGNALWRNGDRDGAIAAHAEAARLDPRLQMQYARTLDVAGRSSEAAAQYAAILEQNPEATTVREDLGRLLFRGGDYAGAAVHLQKAVEGRPNDPVLQQELAYSLDQAGDRRQAEAVYRKVLEAAPEATVSRGLLADNLTEQGRKEEAVTLLREGVAAQPQAPELQRTLGSVLERSGKPQDAAAAYRAYAALAPNAPDAQELLARAALLEKAGGRP
jgi:Flp pilus assembly protein TadD